MDNITNEVLSYIDAELEKNANIFHQIAAGLRGFRQGAAEAARNQKTRAALQRAINTLHTHGALPRKGLLTTNVAQGVGVGTRGPGFFARMSERLRGALAGAKQEFSTVRAADKAVAQLRRLQREEQELRNAAQLARQHGLLANRRAWRNNYSNMTPEEYLKMQGHKVPAHYRARPATRTPQEAATSTAPNTSHNAQPPTPPARSTAQTPTPSAKSTAQTPALPETPTTQTSTPTTQTSHQAQQNVAATEIPDNYSSTLEPGWIERNALPIGLTVGGLALGSSLLRGGPTAAEQDARIQDYMNNAAYDMTTPMPTMSVYASYDDFAEEKRAASTQVYPLMQNAMAQALANQLAQKFVGEPLDAVHKALKKKFFDDPKHREAFQKALESDDMLQAEYRENPKGLIDAYDTLKNFAPSIAKNPSATRSFLRQATMAKMHGSGLDFATIRLMAETEKFIQNAKGRDA
jgi:hypothetical protein